MKNILPFAFVMAAAVCMLVGSCASKADTSTVKIDAKNLDGRELKYFRSYNGVTLAKYTPAELDADSSFTITLPTEGMEYIRILAHDPDRNQSIITKAFYVLPGITEVTIDPLADDNVAVVPPTGNSLDGQAAQSISGLYDLWWSLATGRTDVLDLKADSIPATAIEKLDTYADSITDAYACASPSVRKALERDASLMKLMVFSKCVYLNRKNENASEWKQELALLREKTDMNNPANALNPYFGESIVRNLYAADIYTDYQYPEGLSADSLLCNLTEYFQTTYSGKTAESAIGIMLYNDADQSTFCHSAPAITERFKTLFPESALIPLLEEKVADNNAFNHPEESSDIVFLDNSRIRTLAEVLEPYKGMPVLIDIWATWCGPCRESFAHAGPIQEYAAENGVQLLYISIDEQPGIEDQWKRMARYYKLKGHHLLINSDIKQEVFSTFGNNGYLTIPQQAIVDREGNFILCPQEIAVSADFAPLRTLLDKM
ncbi:MAG: TlpA family protein disulfide reductase [Bacteroidales bacterium]|nr:TlpA family protein disulfide reductase [Bacteroidales bacterium]